MKRQNMISLIIDQDLKNNLKDTTYEEKKKKEKKEKRKLQVTEKSAWFHNDGNLIYTIQCKQVSLVGYLKFVLEVSVRI